MKQKSTPLVLYILMSILLVVSGVLMYLYYQQSKKVVELTTSSSSQLSSISTDEIISRVNVLKPELQQNGKPIVALIKDIIEVSKTNPEFYKDAKNGDYFVLYPKQAVIYRPGENKIINSAVVTK
jgi:hypothetical protein